MKNYIFKNLINFKFILVTIVIFTSIGILTNKDLIFLEGDLLISKLDSILYSFNITSMQNVSIETIKVITIYIGLFYLTMTFISKYLTDMKYLYLLRIRSTRKYILRLYYYTYILIMLYFIVGYIVIILVNSNLELALDNGLYINMYNNNSYIKIIVDTFIINSLIAIFFVNLMIYISIYTCDLRKSIFIVFLIFLSGALGISKLIPGYNIMIIRNISNTGEFNYKYVIIYIVLILISYISLLHLLKRKKDFTLYEYNF